MTKEELARLLNGRQYLNEISEQEEREAKANHLLVVFGYSDDLMECRGVIHDEFYEKEIAVSKDGEVVPFPDRDEIETLKRYNVWDVVQSRRDGAIKVNAVWCSGEGYSWTYSTEEPHARFDIFDGEDKFCRGIVIDLRSKGSGSNCDTIVTNKGS